MPRTAATGQPLIGQSRTVAGRKREVVERLCTRDPRVSPWTGTAHGVLQAVNTYVHREGIVRATAWAERNRLKTLTDGYRGPTARLCRP